MTRERKASPRAGTITAAALDATEQHVARVEHMIGRLRVLYGFSEAEAVLFMQHLPLDPPPPPTETHHVG